jgi:hypothetical protein
MALMLAHNCKEVLIQFPAKAAFSILRMHAYKVNIGFLWPTLRKKADQESRDLIVFFEDETGFTEMFEEQSRQHVTHLPPAPPLIEY